jgi:DNA-binding LacI/PurR family transcriptional regulator
MVRIGVFYREGFDPGAYAVALYHAQAALAGSPHHLSLHTFGHGALDAGIEAADVQALLVFGAEGDDLDALRATARPWVVCERVVEGGNYVAPDNYDMGRKAAEHLLRQGHRSLAVALPGARDEVGEYHGTRLQGFLDTAAKAGHPVDDGDVLFGDKSQAGGEAIAAHLLSRKALPHALYMQNLSQLLGLFRVFHRGSVRIPQDCSVIGTSFRQLNAPEATEHISPAITVVTFEKEEMGRQGVRYLVDAAAGRVAGPLRVLLPGVVVERASTMPQRETYLAATAPEHSRR